LSVIGRDFQTRSKDGATDHLDAVASPIIGLEEPLTTVEKVLLIKPTSVAAIQRERGRPLWARRAGSDGAFTSAA
jgi:hypothetical protein